MEAIVEAQEKAVIRTAVVMLLGRIIGSIQRLADDIAVAAYRTRKEGYVLHPAPGSEEYRRAAEEGGK